MSSPTVPEELVGFIHALAEAPALRQWLLNLQPLPMVERRSILNQIADQMQKAQEAPGLVAAVRTLTRPAFYDAACQTLLELGDPEGLSS